jgi:hypothetical protein
MDTAKKDLAAALKAKVQSLGLRVTEENADGFKAEQENILIKWLLGQKKVLYRMSVRFAEPEHQTDFREMVKERSWGLLPPTFTVEKTSQRGVELSGTHEEHAMVGGGGKVDFGKVREALKKAIADAGWGFHYEAGRAP